MKKIVAATGMFPAVMATLLLAVSAVALTGCGDSAMIITDARPGDQCVVGVGPGSGGGLPPGVSGRLHRRPALPVERPAVRLHLHPRRGVPVGVAGTRAWRRPPTPPGDGHGRYRVPRQRAGCDRPSAARAPRGSGPGRHVRQPCVELSELHAG
jgi:hypothetical protein